MAQSALSVTPGNPTPPTNLSCVGSRPPTDPAQAYADDGVPAFTATQMSWNEPSGSRIVFAAPTAAAGSGTSNPAEGAGTEVSYTAPGGMITVSDLGSYTNQPNAQHASSLSPATNPTLTSISPTSAVHGASGTDTITCTGTGFTKQSVVYANGVKQPTTYVSPTSITAAVTKATAAGTSSITVVTGGVVTTAAQTLTYT
jgi:IPT/TIG domain